MSDPVTNADIEDVLSSIRRLVSDEPSGLNKRKPATEAAGDRFVLTPALRIAESQEPETHDAEQTNSMSGPNAESDFVADDDSSEALDRPDNILTLTAGATEEESGQDASDGDDPAFEMADAFMKGEDPVADHRTTLEQRIAELEAALQQSPDEWEPDGSEVADRDSRSSLTFDDADDAEPADDLSEPSAQAENDDSIDDQNAADALPEAVLEMASEGSGETLGKEPEGVLMLEDVQVESDHGSDRDQADTPDDAAEIPADDGSSLRLPEEDQKAPLEAAEPESAEAFEYTPETSQEAAFPIWNAPDAEDQAAEDPKAEPEAVELDAGTDRDSEQDDEAEEPVTGFDIYADEALLDEEALREMVSQIVRQELQGVLGERITRNVRRLVRREIQRAMAIRDLD